MKTQIAIFFAILSSGLVAQNNNLYQFKVKTLEGEEFDLASLKGKKVMVVNVASKCGYTPQYADLQSLYEQYVDSNFTIIAFPANNFLNQEPGDASQIREFCTANYGVTFPVMEKISVKGKDIHPLYSWLTQKSENGIMDAPVQWNFQKFLIDENGNLVKMIPPKQSPLSEEVLEWIQN
ncbi:MAG: glutathione peroxidase [Bacteroidetes bacterium HGW-Bacteroidetes-6]|jgi:glutathione peroxidase|nr:MAG: glutathione peroxidase [Bacteroidetes bacterium HGW-Bacteroidetes-6]